jgi:hypothetical protein
MTAWLNELCMLRGSLLRAAGSAPKNEVAGAEGGAAAEVAEPEDDKADHSKGLSLI